VLADPNAGSSRKVRAAKELAKLRRPVEGPPQAADGDPRVAMEALVARMAPDPPELEKVAADLCETSSSRRSRGARWTRARSPGCTAT
jgi:hypothetical protein